MSIAKQSKQSWVGDAGMLVASITLCFGVAASGSFFPPDEWYASLNRPTLAPPNWVFGPVWSLLYTVMAISAWLVWKASGFKGARSALIAFGAQLILNSVWSALFFGLHRPDLALIEIVVLWISIAVTIAMFWRHSKTAAYLLLPYLAWVSFAAFLNYGFWSLNS